VEILPWLPIAFTMRIHHADPPCGSVSPSSAYWDQMTFGITGHYDSTPDLHVLAQRIEAESATFESGLHHRVRGDMLIDQRGSEVLNRTECARLLTIKAGGVGRLGLVVDGQPAVIPLNYSLVDGDVVIQIGPGTVLTTIREARPIVAFEVDDVPAEPGSSWWSVMVQGFAEEVTDTGRLARLRQSSPFPAVPEPGESLVRIRADVLSGRRFTAREGR
jgi:nitroimidazol reductase NimA-like FMN-containing flavoprotein (pyridoxamine 5'-phosphate oxidase superfamily)